MAEKYNAKVWTEIASFGLLAALGSWMLYHALHHAAPENPDQSIPEAEENPASAPYSAASLPSVGIPPISLPGQSDDGCGCSSGCAVGSTTNPTLSTIVNQTNAAIAAMQLMVQQTLQQEADIGNEGSGGFIDYVVG